MEKSERTSANRSRRRFISHLISSILLFMPNSSSEIPAVLKKRDAYASEFKETVGAPRAGTLITHNYDLEFCLRFDLEKFAFKVRTEPLNTCRRHRTVCERAKLY